MADDEQDGHAGRELATGLLETAVVGVAGAVDPSGGVLTAFGSHLLTNAGSDSAWRRADLDLWKDIITDEGSERRRQYEETQDEFRRYSLIIDWLKDELRDLRAQVEDLEVVALGMLQDSENLLRQRPEPEMRPYLLNAWRNALQRRDRFPPTWMRRLTEHLGNLGVEHLKMLEDLVQAARLSTNAGKRPDGSLTVEIASPKKQRLVAGDGGLIWTELLDRKLLEKRIGGRDLILTAVCMRLVELVSAPEDAEPPPND